MNPKDTMMTAVADDGWDALDTDTESSRKRCGPAITAEAVPTNTNGLVTAKEAQVRYGVPMTRTSRWKYREMVNPYGYRGRFPLYRASDLRRLNTLAEFDCRSK